MAKLIKSRFGVHTFYNTGKDRTVWYGTPEAQDAAHKREQALIGKKPSDVKYAKKIRRS